MSGKPRMAGVIPLGGGMTIGLEQAGFESVANAEIDDDWASNITLNRPEIQSYNGYERWEEFTELMREDPPELVYGSPPCQGVSGMNRHSGADAAKNQWSNRFTDTATQIGPRFIIWENIPRMLSIGRRTVMEVEELARRRGYTMTVHQHQVFNFGVSQRRRRVMFVFEKRGKEIVWPNDPAPERDQMPSLWDVISDLDLMEPADDYYETPCFYNGDALNEWQARLRNPDGYTHDHDYAPMPDRYSHLPQGKQWLYMPEEHMSETELRRKREGTIFNAVELFRLHPDHIGPTLTGARNKLHPHRNRLISVREASRMMAFPDDWKWAKKKDYQQFAAGVCPPVAHWFGDTIQAELSGTPLPTPAGRLF